MYNHKSQGYSRVQMSTTKWRRNKYSCKNSDCPSESYYNPAAVISFSFTEIDVSYYTSSKNKDYCSSEKFSPKCIHFIYLLNYRLKLHSCITLFIISQL